MGGIEILVATPGRLLDHAGSKLVNLTNVEVLVLDEADRMLDMGFIDDIRKIIAMLPVDRQNLLFSATLAPEVRVLANTILREPLEVDVAPKVSAAESVDQVVYLVDADRKRDLLAHLVRKRDLRQVLVFTRTKHMAARLAGWLDRDGVEATAIHGDRTQSERERALEQFKSGEVRVLVATDVAARGLDIEGLPQVVNFELPYHPQDYVHRIGRTGRAGMEGHAISLVSLDEEDQLDRGQQAPQARPARAPGQGLRAGPACRGGTPGQPLERFAQRRQRQQRRSRSDPRAAAPADPARAGSARLRAPDRGRGSSAACRR